MQHKLLTRTLAAVLSLTLVAGALPPAGFGGLNIDSAALTAVAAENPNDPNSITYTGDYGTVEYYNVRSKSFDDNAALFYQDLLGHTENMGVSDGHASPRGYSFTISDYWLRLAVILLHGAGTRTTPLPPLNSMTQSNETYYNMTYNAILYQKNNFTANEVVDGSKRCTISEMKWDTAIPL